MTEITTLSQRLNTRTRHFVLLTLMTFGIWPLLWLYKKQSIISDTTGIPIYNTKFIIWLAVSFGGSQLLRLMASEPPYGYNSTGDLLAVLSGLLTLTYGVMLVVWAFKVRTALRLYTLRVFHFELKMRVFYTIVFNVNYIIYCINAMQSALVKHQNTQGVV